MRELLNFFIRNSRWWILTIYLILSCILLFTHNPYQQHVWLTSASEVSASVNGVATNVTSYFNLKDNNEDLNRRNAQLQQEVIALQEELQRLREIEGEGDTLPFRPVQHYKFVVAHVVSNSVMRPHNYITVNKGAVDGVKPEMGVIDQNGVVGIVNVVSDNYARLISLLNPNFRLSCKIKGNDSFGSLVWDGEDPHIAILEELPRHTKFNPGDTVITSGYSAVFPEGIPVGIIEKGNGVSQENFFSLRVRLLSDFTKLSDVQIVINNDAEELRALELENRKTEGQ